MIFTEQARAILRGLRTNPGESVCIREAESLYWKILEENVAACIREKTDCSALVTQEYDLINFGITPETLENASAASAMSATMRLMIEPNRHVRMLLVSDWLSEAYWKAIAGDRREALEKGMQSTQAERLRLENDANAVRHVRKDCIVKCLGIKYPADELTRTVDMVDHADEVYCRNRKIRKRSSRGVFIPVVEKRKHYEQEQEYAAIAERIERLLSQAEPQATAADIKRSTQRIHEISDKLLDMEESIDRMNEALATIDNKRRTATPAELEASMRAEIDHVKELTRLAAKRLHIENCCFIRPNDACCTVKDVNECIDRIIEFDPDVFHNSRAALFGLPGVLLIPGCGNSLYDWKNNRLVVPLITPGGNFMASVAAGIIEYRLDADEDKRLLNSYQKLTQHKDVKSIFHLKDILTKDYITWMTSEYKGYKTLSHEEREWFEHEIAPDKNEIFTPLEYRGYMLAKDAFVDKCKEVEGILAQGLQAVPENVLWVGSILMYQQGKFDRAMELLKARVGKDPVFAPAYYNLGQVCVKLMRKQEAIQYFGEYCRRNPQSWWAATAMEHIRRLQSSGRAG